MTDLLNTLTPVIAIGGLALVMTLERWQPYFEHGPGRGRQRWHNLGLVAIGFAMNAVLSGFLAIPILWAETNQFGLMHRLNVWTPAVATGEEACAFLVRASIERLGIRK